MDLINNELSICITLNKKRELLINKFIEKFPKVKLQTIIEINKYYNQNYDTNTDSDTNTNKVSNINDIIYDYLLDYHISL